MFRRDGSSIRSTIAVTVGETLAGAKVRVDTVPDAVELAAPKSSNSGTILRLRGGYAPGAKRRAVETREEIAIGLRRLCMPCADFSEFPKCWRSLRFRGIMKTNDVGNDVGAIARLDNQIRH
jgi:hypothetical protein